MRIGATQPLNYAVLMCYETSQLRAICGTPKRMLAAIKTPNGHFCRSIYMDTAALELHTGLYKLERFRRPPTCAFGIPVIFPPELVSLQRACDICGSANAHVDGTWTHH